jgi:hypothetical protein
MLSDGLLTGLVWVNLRLNIQCCFFNSLVSYLLFLNFLSSILYAFFIDKRDAGSGCFCNGFFVRMEMDLSHQGNIRVKILN